MEFPFQPNQRVGLTLTLQLFKPSFQDVWVLHLINKCCWGQAGLSVPVFPLHGLFSKCWNNPLRYRMNGSSSVWHSGGKCPTKSVSNPWEGLKEKKFCISKTPRFILLFLISSMLCHKLKKCCRLFSSSSTVCPTLSNEHTAVNAWVVDFSMNHFKLNWRTKCSLVSPPPVKNFTTLVASEQSENYRCTPLWF